MASHAALDVVIERYDAVYGGIENETGEIGDVALEAFDKLIWCTPASMDGVRALLTYMLDDVADLGHQFLEEDKPRALLSSIDDALTAAHQAA